MDGVNDFGYDTASSSNSLVIVGEQPPVSAIPPVVTGVAAFPDGLLSTTNGTWDHSPDTFTYRWYKDGQTIVGASSSTYVPLETDIGANISSEVDAANAFGSGIAASGNAPIISDQRPPASTTAPLVSGTTAFPNGLLSTTNGTWDHSPSTFFYRWYKDGSIIVGATAQTYVPLEADIGANISSEVDARNSSGENTASSINALVVADERSPVLSVPPLVSGAAVFPDGLLSTTNGSWDGPAPSSYAYEWYRNGSFISGASSQTYVPVEADAGKDISSAVESDQRLRRHQRRIQQLPTRSRRALPRLCHRPPCLWRGSLP